MDNKSVWRGVEQSVCSSTSAKVRTAYTATAYKAHPVTRKQLMNKIKKCRQSPYFVKIVINRIRFDYSVKLSKINKFNESKGILNINEIIEFENIYDFIQYSEYHSFENLK